MVNEINPAKLKVKLQLKNTFLGCIAVMSKWEETTEVPTAATDGYSIMWNPNWLGNLNPEEQLGVIAHECMHVALQHMFRAKTLKIENHQLYNLAGDFVINDMLRQEGYKLPEGGAECPSCYKGWTTEQIYKDLLEKQLPPPTYTMSGDVIPPDTEDKSDKEVEQQISDLGSHLKKVLAQAKFADNSGWSNKCGEFKRTYEDLMNPKLPWYALLRNYVNDTIKDDYSWSRPNRRYLSNDLYLPSNQSEGLTKVNVYIDASGSIGNRELNAFMSEIIGMHKLFEFKELTGAFFSTLVHDEFNVSDTVMLPQEIHSTGGTDIEPVVEDILKKKPVVSIIFTDGYFDMSSINKLNSPVIWCIFENNEFKPAKGRVVYFSI